MSAQARAAILGGVIAFICIILGLPLEWSIGIGAFVTVSTIMAEKDSND